LSHRPSHGFRSQQRFTDPASEESPPPEWTAPTPPNGLPISQPTPNTAPPPYPELSTATLLRQSNPQRLATGTAWQDDGHGGDEKPCEKRLSARSNKPR
jgi:hypothetical protein